MAWYLVKHKDNFALRDKKRASGLEVQNTWGSGFDLGELMSGQVRIGTVCLQIEVYHYANSQRSGVTLIIRSLQ
jgi:hypothetical protein